VVHTQLFPAGQSDESILQSQIISRGTRSTAVGAARIIGTVAKITARDLRTNMVDDQVFVLARRRMI
jgi:hypothetical protein